MKVLKRYLIFVALTIVATFAFASPSQAGVFTTTAPCAGAIVNIFGAKGDVYLSLDTHGGALPNGSYYVQVTEPNGTVLGSSFPNTVMVAGGSFVACNQLTAIVTKASDSSPGFDSTSNPGGEYKVWVSLNSAFPNNQSSTDNFKVRENAPVQSGTLRVRKYYDANANGLNDDGILLTNWMFHIQDGIDYIRYTPVDVVVEADTYTVTEFTPVETNWINTDPGTSLAKTVILPDGGDETVFFGNVCVGAGGGMTLGFWSNKNGQSLVDSLDLGMLTNRNLRNSLGGPFDPGSYAAFRAWILGASATNMAYMLSAQLAAMELNVFNGKVNGAALVYAPGATSANGLGFASVNALMSEANTSLGTDGNTVAAGATRAYQEALKNALDRANNNLNFVQAQPCAYTFAQP